MGDENVVAGRFGAYKPYDPEEPDWSMWFLGPLDGYPKAIPASYGERASTLWRDAVKALIAQGTLEPANEPAVLRLVIASVRYEYYVSRCLVLGEVIEAKKSGVWTHSPFATAASRAHSEALELERELCLSPKHRAIAAKAESKAKDKGQNAQRYGAGNRPAPGGPKK